MQINGGQHVINFGFSQSAVVATQEMQRLMALPVDMRPDPSDLSFVLAGNPPPPTEGSSPASPECTSPSWT
ncbi:PE-PPE domain protein [Mycobacterium ulcerans str. Harvey]|uniref:PE-PPE domain protein n=1 Tax=Mycobacterium ulcerans str. Harvey TaxID=1299332 RepID=A0ABP3A3E9_MYCUL|nr:PE-PPE domain protein [Mycobacterium ulcerans str. Harvey]